MPTERLRALAERHPALALALLAECGQHLRRLVGLIEDLALPTVHGRPARLLLEHAHAAAAGGALPLTQAAMAVRLGTVREMISRTLRTFEGMGLIVLRQGAITAGLGAIRDG